MGGRGMKSTRRSGRKTFSPGKVFRIPPLHWARKIFRPAALSQVIRELFARPSAPAPRRIEARSQRSQSFTLEALEPRLLLSADIAYSTASLTGGSFTLRATSATVLDLHDDTADSSVGSVTVNAGDNSFSIARDLGLGAGYADSLHIDLDSFNALDPTIGAGHKLSLTFDGGDQRLLQDLVSLDGTTGAVGYSLSIASNSSISSSGTASVTGDLSITSEQTGIGGAGVSSQGLLANANTGITLTGA